MLSKLCQSSKNPRKGDNDEEEEPKSKNDSPPAKIKHLTKYMGVHSGKGCTETLNAAFKRKVSSRCCQGKKYYREGYRVHTAVLDEKSISGIEKHNKSRSLSLHIWICFSVCVMAWKGSGAKSDGERDTSGHNSPGDTHAHTSTLARTPSACQFWCNGYVKTWIWTLILKMGPF